MIDNDDKDEVAPASNIKLMEPNMFVETALEYVRLGFAPVRLRLNRDGSIVGGPGHAEVSWGASQAKIQFFDDNGNKSAEFHPDGDIYVGRVFDRIDATLNKWEWSTSYRFSGRVRRLLRAVSARTSPRYFVGIPFVNRPDLLTLAVQSITGVADTVVIDNSPGHILSRLNIKATIYTPPVPLSFVQSMNVFQEMAHQASCEWLGIMHNDAEALPGAAQRFVKEVNQLGRCRPRWGVAFTNYDALCAFHMEMVRDVGPWCDLFTQYFADNEYYARVEKYGWSKVDLGGDDVLHHVSQTISSDSRRQHANSISFPAYERIYRELFS